MVSAGVSYALGRGFDSLLRHRKTPTKQELDSKVDRKVDHAGDEGLTRLAAKARILEAISRGDARVLATELREDLEALCPSSAKVIPMDPSRRK